MIRVASECHKLRWAPSAQASPKAIADPEAGRGVAESSGTGRSEMPGVLLLGWALGREMTLGPISHQNPAKKHLRFRK